MYDLDNMMPLLEAVVSYIDEGVLLSDREGRILYQNPAAGELLGAPSNQPLECLSDIKSIDLQDALERVMARADHRERAGERVTNLIQFELTVDVDGEHRDLEFHCCRPCEAQAHLRLVMIQDRTDGRRLQSLLDRSNGDLITKDASMLEILDRVERVAPMQAPVLLQGESGTGKTHIARLLHRLSRRSKRPFVELNCAAIPDQLIESELFGHVRGAFTGASSDRVGRFRAAHGGTLFLDEIGDVPLHLQPKLLRAIQDGIIEPVGSDKPVKVDVRIISASNKNLRDLVDNSEFRADLYYRLAVFPLHVPPIRERRGDIPLLFQHFCRKLGQRGYPADVQWSPQATRMMMEYPWPGNVRELENAVEHAIICAPDRIIRPENLPHDVRAFKNGNGNGHGAAGNGSQRQAERDEINEALAQAGGNKTLAAKYLGIDRTTLWRRMRRLGISDDFTGPQMSRHDESMAAGI